MASLYDEVKKPQKGNSLYSLSEEPAAEGAGDSNYGEAFLSGAVHGATGGYLGGEYEPKNTGESIAKTAGDVAGFTVPMLALGPIGRAGATALGMAKSLAAKEAIVGAVYGFGRKPEEGESRVGNAAKDAAIFGGLGLAGEVVGAGDQPGGAGPPRPLRRRRRRRPAGRGAAAARRLRRRLRDGLPAI